MDERIDCLFLAAPQKLDSTARSYASFEKLQSTSQFSSFSRCINESELTGSVSPPSPVSATASPWIEPGRLEEEEFAFCAAAALCALPIEEADATDALAAVRIMLQM